MSGETETRPSGWTVDTLKEYIQQRFTDQDKAVQSALSAAKEAVNKAETAADKRFEAVNEFRQTLSDQTSTFMSRTEYEAKYDALQKQLDVLTKLVYIGLGAVLALQIVLQYLKR